MEHEELERMTEQYLMAVLDDEVTVGQMREKKERIMQVVGTAQPTYRPKSETD